MKQNNTTKKLALAGVLTALAIVGSFISVPVAGSKCAPVQHMVNILAAVTLGPAWGVGIAFCASLLRNLQVYSAICSASEALWLSLEAWSVLYAVVLSTKNSTS